MTAKEWEDCPKITLNKFSEEKNVVLTTENVALYRLAILNDLGIGTFAKFSDSIFVENRNLYQFYTPIDNTKQHLVIICKPDYPVSNVDRLEGVLKS